MKAWTRANAAHAMLCFWLGALLGPLGYWFPLAIVRYAQAGHEDYVEFYSLILLPVLAGAYSLLASLGYFIAGWLVPRIDADHALRLCGVAAAIGVLCFLVWQLVGVRYLYQMGQPPTAFSLIALVVAIPLVPLVVAVLTYHLAVSFNLLTAAREV